MLKSDDSRTDDDGVNVGVVEKVGDFIVDLLDGVEPRPPTRSRPPIDVGQLRLGLFRDARVALDVSVQLDD